MELFENTTAFFIRCGISAYYACLPPHEQVIYEMNVPTIEQQMSTNEYYLLEVINKSEMLPRYYLGENISTW